MGSSGGGFGGSRAVAEQHSDVVIVNSTVETTLATLAIPTTAAAGDVLRADFVGDLVNSTGGSITFQVKVKLGATTIFDSGAQSLSSNSQRRSVLAEVRILIAAAADQRSVWSYTIGTGTLSSGQGVGTNIAARGTSATEDLTAGKNLTFTATIGAGAAATTDVTIHEAFLTHIKK